MSKCIAYHHEAKFSIWIFEAQITCLRVRRVARGVTGVSTVAFERVDLVRRPPKVNRNSFIIFLESFIGVVEAVKVNFVSFN